jgi:hypothetical protein
LCRADPVTRFGISAGQSGADLLHALLSAAYQDTLADHEQRCQSKRAATMRTMEKS